MANDAISLTAAKEHLIRRKVLSAHVIVCHNLDVRTRDVMGLWSAANRVDDLLLRTLSRELLEDILVDSRGLQEELQGIERWALAQIEKLDRDGL